MQRGVAAPFRARSSRWKTCGASAPGFSIRLVQPTAGWQVSVGASQRLFATTAVGTNLYTSFQGTNDACTVDGTLSKFPLTGGTDSTPTPMNGCTEAMVNSWYWNQIWFDTENPHHKMTWAIRPPS